MPNRLLKESICTSESVNQLNFFQEVFFYRLIVVADDFGRMDARPAILKARLFALKDRVTLKDINGALTKLAELGMIKLYEVDGKPYLYFPTWLDHQKPRANKSKYPAPDDPASTCIQIADICSTDVNSLQQNALDTRYSIYDTRYTRESKPTLDEIEAYVAEKGLTINAKDFFDFYDANDWKDSKGNKVKSWKQKALTWQNHQKPKKRLELNAPIPQQKGTADDISRMKKLIEEMQNA